MDIELQNEINTTIEHLHKLSVEEFDFEQMDPIVKMMMVALLHEVHKIKDKIDSTPQHIVERYCADFVPHENVNATPAIALVQPTLRKKDGLTTIGTGSAFEYKQKELHTTYNYIPLFSTLIVGQDKAVVQVQNNEYSQRDNLSVPNRMWVGVQSETEIESMKGFSLLIMGTKGICPEHIRVGINDQELDFSTMREMENIEMVEPFDAQQASGQFFGFVNTWKENLLYQEDTLLIYITDDLHDRDAFKPRQYPKTFEHWLEESVLEKFSPNTIWLQIDFPHDYVVPETCEVIPNVVPVVNINVNSLTLTNASPIAKLQKQEESFFLKVLETSTNSKKQGFSSTQEDIIIRDYDASRYHNGDLYRDVRNLYNRFIDDYFAFVEYNSIKDGEALKLLRETINKLGKSVGDKNAKFKFDSGTYVMKNMNQSPQTSSTKVTYITTQGEAGNILKAGDYVECKKQPAIEPTARVIVSAMGGADKATVDERYELLRYYALTNDRLYTKMDIDAFLRKEIIARFGKEEFKRIFIHIYIEGTGGTTVLQRGMYIDIEFKDKKNYDKAVKLSFDKLLKQRIGNRACIAMPIIINMKNLEGDHVSNI